MKPLSPQPPTTSPTPNLPVNSPEPAGRQRLLLGLAGAGILLLGAGAGLHWWRFQSTHIATENAQVKGHLSPISARVTATVKAVEVSDGDYVKAGQTLVILENPDLDRLCCMNNPGSGVSPLRPVS